jgi:hypothetical protein
MLHVAMLRTALHTALHYYAAAANYTLPCLPQVAMPGKLFWADEPAQTRGAPCPLLRATFGGLCETDITEGFRRLGAALQAAVAAEKLLEAASPSTPLLSDEGGAGPLSL